MDQRRKRKMSEKYKIENGVVYELIGEIYYPIFSDADIQLGIYANKRIEYLIATGKLSKETALKNKQFRHELFRLNCFCEQLCQKLMEEYLRMNPSTSRYLRRNKYQQLQKEIIDKYILK